MVAAFHFITERLASPEYNCSAYSPEDWSRQFGERNFVLGSWSLILGCISLFLYIPALRTFSRHTLNCVKIMRFLALVDMVGIFCSGVLFGVQLYMGAVFCSHELFIVATSLCGFG
ncbi:hypothetical protein PMAYCL1PPCAC_01055, partial [Pristionchus mayeri]